jgi:hypothetical protein
VTIAAKIHEPWLHAIEGYQRTLETCVGPVWAQGRTMTARRVLANPLPAAAIVGVALAFLYF